MLNQPGEQLLGWLDEFFWVLRRQGLDISVVQATDAVQVIKELGWQDPLLLRRALACVLVRSRRDYDLVTRCFASYFRQTPAPPDAGAKRPPPAEAMPSDQQAIEHLLAVASEHHSDLVEPLRRLWEAAQRPSEGYAWLRQAHQRTTASRLPITASTVGQGTQRLLGAMSVPALSLHLAALGERLATVVGPERAQRLVRLLEAHLLWLRHEAREMIAQQAAPSAAREVPAPGRHALGEKPWACLQAEEREQVGQAVRELATRLLRAAQGRRLRARRRAEVDGAKTLRAAALTGGVPLRLVRRGRKRERPEIWLLCDVSDSMRDVVPLLWEWMAALQHASIRHRSFIFVSELAEITALLGGASAAEVMGRVAAGEVLSTDQASNYARAFESFHRGYRAQLTGRSTLCIFGDGRTNRASTGRDTLRDLVRRAGHTLWLCPDPPSTWGVGDSAMPVYAHEVAAVLPASTPRELLESVRYLHHQRDRR